MSESSDTDRDVSSVSVDGEATSFLSPTEQAAEDRRLADRNNLKKTKRLSQFFRITRVTTRDVP